MIKMLDDNKTSFILIRDLKSQKPIKHINIMHYYMGGLVDNGELAIKQIFNLKILVDDLTKALPTKPFKKHQEKWKLEKRFNRTKEQIWLYIEDLLKVQKMQ